MIVEFSHSLPARFILGNKFSKTGVEIPDDLDLDSLFCRKSKKIKLVNVLGFEFEEEIRLVKIF